MGWTYQQYLVQPAWFITLLKIKNETEAEFDRNQTANMPKPKSR